MEQFSFTISSFLKVRSRMDEEVMKNRITALSSQDNFPEAEQNDDASDVARSGVGVGFGLESSLHRAEERAC